LRLLQSFQNPWNKAMNLMNTRFLFAALAVLTVAGCATRKPVKPSYKPAEPLVQVIPPQGKEEPRVIENSNRPEAIYVNPVIEEVEMAPYISDEGNLVFPGKMMVIREPGHWNLNAAQKSQPYFVPADNQPPQLVPPSKSYYDYIQSKKNGRRESGLDLSRVRVLGYVDKADRPVAESELLSGETIAFDPHLGWLAIPQSIMAEEKEVFPTLPPAVESSSVSVTNVAPQFSDEVITNGPPAEPGANPQGIAEQQKRMRGLVEKAIEKARNTP
jgi:hypothetical protein